MWFSEEKEKNTENKLSFSESVFSAKRQFFFFGGKWRPTSCGALNLWVFISVHLFWVESLVFYFQSLNHWNSIWSVCSVLSMEKKVYSRRAIKLSWCCAGFWWTVPFHLEAPPTVPLRYSGTYTELSLATFASLMCALSVNSLVMFLLAQLISECEFQAYLNFKQCDIFYNTFGYYLLAGFW